MTLRLKHLVGGLSAPRPSQGSMASAPCSAQSTVAQGTCRVHLFITSVVWRPSFWDTLAAVMHADWTLTGMHWLPQTPDTPWWCFCSWTGAGFVWEPSLAEVKPWSGLLDKSKRTTAPSSSTLSYMSLLHQLEGTPEGPFLLPVPSLQAAVVPAGICSSNHSTKLQQGCCWATQLSHLPLQQTTNRVHVTWDRKLWMRSNMEVFQPPSYWYL